ncbi:nucleotide exchange factor GrpE [Verrucomicrobium spinosum]|uniref:nucleotide exchange factor GrpE n=1 Tax=Verrucomicrobium spinosum TaxID=2736 RepID=UPI000174643B|nr:nucleotide exchange factor GrpE [Verrucomicrobium spinosum]
MNSTTEEPIAAQESAAPEIETQAAEAASESQTAPAAADPISELQAEVAKWKDSALRTAAELDNYRKRVARETQESRAYANADLLRDLFPILDNFEMGLDAAKAESEKSMIYIGLSMVRRQLADFLRDAGVEEVPGQGAKFDPNVHEAVSHEASADQPEGTILKVMRRGFKLKDRLLRAATVSVSSGPPAA